MFFLLDAADLIKPELGLSFWTLVVFLVLWFILGKFAFKPIVQALKDREKNIEESLTQAEKARSEMANLVAKNEMLLEQAKEERNKILAEARDLGENLKASIVEKAKVEAGKKVEDAIREIETQKKAALVDMKNKIGEMALEIASKVVRKELSSDAAQVEYVDKLVKEVNLN